MRFADETLDDLTALMERDFGPLAAAEDWHRSLLAWLQFRARLIPPRPRRVVLSDEVVGLQPEFPAIQRLMAMLSEGDSIAPWLSERVRTRKTDLKADIMFNAWQVSHFHLSEWFERPLTAKRSGPLLFVYVTADTAVMLDVAPHGAWSQQSLLRILLRTWPAGMDTELRDVLPGSGWSDAELGSLARKGITAPVNIDGRVFAPPGMGVTMAGSAVRFGVFGSMLLKMLKQVATELAGNSLPRHLMTEIAGQIGVPLKLGVRFDGGAFHVYEKNRQLDLMSTRCLA